MCGDVAAAPESESAEGGEGQKWGIWKMREAGIVHDAMLMGRRAGAIRSMLCSNLVCSLASDKLDGYHYETR